MTALPVASYMHFIPGPYEADLRLLKPLFVSGRQHVLAAAGTAGLITAMNVYLHARTFAR